MKTIDRMVAASVTRTIEAVRSERDIRILEELKASMRAEITAIEGRLSGVDLALAILRGERKP